MYKFQIFQYLRVLELEKFRKNGISLVSVNMVNIRKIKLNIFPKKFIFMEK